MDDETTKAIHTTMNHLEHYLRIRPDYNRIVDLVQRNPDFFGIQLGEDCFEKAADKLEQIVNKSE